MGKRRGGETILRNILNISRSKDGNGKGSRAGSLWCPYGRKEQEEGNGFYCRGEPPNPTPPSPENPNLAGELFKEKEEDVGTSHLEELVKKVGDEGECEGVEESSRRIKEFKRREEDGRQQPSRRPDGRLDPHVAPSPSVSLSLSHLPSFLRRQPPPPCLPRRRHLPWARPYTVS